VARPRSIFRLFRGQFEALRLDGVPELLLSSAARGVPAGASYLLRAMALRACTSRDGTSVLILQKDETDVYRDHVGGQDGLLSMVREMQSHGFAEALQGEIRFRNGSSIRWIGCNRESEALKALDRRPDVLLVDQAEDVSEHVFTLLRDATLASPHPLRRVVAAARSALEPGWVSRHWSVNGSSGRRVFLLDPKDLDPELIKRPAFPSYREWLERHFGGKFIWAPHTPSIVGAVDRWIDGAFDHLAIFIPSQHGKTEAGPRHAVPYILHRFPSDWCSIVSYNTKIANKRSADARANFKKSGGEFEPGRQAVQEWKTKAGGGCWSAGMAAGQTGNPASWVFPDDPDQDWADAVNKSAQEKKRTRYGSVLRARESMFAAEMRRQKLCATVTRWDKGDLIGYAMGLSHAALAENPTADEKWGILALSAVYDPAVLDGYREMYPLFEILPDFRTEPGTPLWPERRSADAWRVVFKIRGPIIAACECQQNPKGVERGGNFESEWFVRLDRDPAIAGLVANEDIYEICVRAWDLASTEGGGDFTVGSKMGRTKAGGDIILRHVVRGQFAPRGVKQLIAAAMLLDGPGVKIRIPIDPATGGEGWADEIVRYLREVAGWVGMPVPEIICKRPRRAATATLSAKAARADAFRSRAQPPAPDIPGGIQFVGASWEPAISHLVENWSEKVSAHPELREIAAKGALFAGDWWTFWLQILQSFTGDEGRIDDDVDATVDAYEEVYEEPPPPAQSAAMPRPPGW